MVWVAVLIVLSFLWFTFPKLPMYQQIFALVMVGLVVWGLVLPALQGGS